MKIPTFLFDILLLNISTIFICTNALGEEGNIPFEENVYPPPPPNGPQNGGIRSGPTATLYNENDLDEMMNKFKPEDLNEIMALLDDENWNHGNVPPVIDQQSTQIDHQFIHPSNLNAPNLQNPLPVTSENLQNREPFSNIGQESQLNKGKDKGKRKLDEYLEQNPSNANESNQLISNPYADWLREGILLPIENDQSSKRLAITNNDENIQNSSSTQQNSLNNISMNNQSMGQNQMQNIQPTTILEFSNPIADNNAHHSHIEMMGNNPTNVINNEPQNQEIFYRTCDVCKKVFKWPTQLKRHILVHTGEKPYECNWDGCEKRFGLRSNLLKHELSAHRPNEMTFECNWPDCGKKFTHESFLLRHRKSHGKVKKFVCRYPECNKNFASLNGRKYHERIHQTNFVPFKCTFQGCQKEFNCKENLLVHEVKHQNKSAICEKCGKDYKVKKYLDSHSKRCQKEENNIMESTKGPMN